MFFPPMIYEGEGRGQSPPTANLLSIGRGERRWDDIGSGRKRCEIVVRHIQHLEEMGDGWEAQAAVGKAGRVGEA